MRRADLAVSVLLLALGLVVIAEAVRLGFRWSASGPQSGFFPLILGCGLVVCACITFRKAAAEFRREGAGKRLVPRGAWKPLLWVVVPSTAMVALTPFVGLHLAAALYLAFYMRAVGKIGWATTLAIALLAPAALYVTFDKLFMVPLPQGLWGAKLIPF